MKETSNIKLGYEIDKKIAASFNARYSNLDEDATATFEKILLETGKLSEVASHFGFSRGHASYMFSKLFNVTLAEFKKIRAQTNR